MQGGGRPQKTYADLRLVVSGLIEYFYDVLPASWEQDLALGGKCLKRLRIVKMKIYIF